MYFWEVTLNNNCWSEKCVHFLFYLKRFNEKLVFYCFKRSNVNACAQNSKKKHHWHKRTWFYGKTKISRVMTLETIKFVMINQIRSITVFLINLLIMIKHPRFIRHFIFSFVNNVFSVIRFKIWFEMKLKKNPFLKKSRFFEIWLKLGNFFSFYSIPELKWCRNRWNFALFRILLETRINLVKIRWFMNFFLSIVTFVFELNGQTMALKV